MARLLLLEDNSDFAEMVSEDLRGRGHTVEIATCAASALSLYQEHGADLVIADVFIEKDGVLTKGGGVTLVHRLKNFEDFDLPVIAISGAFESLNGKEISSTMKTVGADALLAKPFMPEELSDLIDKLLVRAQHRRNRPA